ncbi:MAG: hypothetical protein JSS58_08265 [Proteobacteria bacterium]|nr:hypothetical protein [Pseudomonadota bacterium]
MSHLANLAILLPFALPPAEMANDLLRVLRACKTPALAMLLARAPSPAIERFDGFSHALPHEIWLARQFGLDRGTQGSNSPPLACAAMRQLGLPAEDGVWFVLNPVHLHIARDHIVLTDARQLDLTEAESRHLFDTARTLVEEEGKLLRYGDAKTWFLRADDWKNLQTATPDAACGHNIDIWMPQGDGERAWRKLQNEIQMHWHIHAVNDAREARAAKPVNSLWLWGGATASLQAKPATAPTICELPSQLAVYAPPGSASAQADNKLIASDQLIAPALAGDWGAWLQQLHALENEQLAPALEALQSGALKQLTLVLSHNTALAEFVITRNSLRKFWAKPSLKKLLV